jgi:phage gp45-like
MWLSKQMKPAVPTSDADLGVTTISGKQVGVVTRGEVRDLPVYGPGGYLWTPASGTAVLVVKGGPGGEEQCVAGARPPEGAKQIEPGEVYIYGPGGNSLYLRRDGSVEIRGGKVSIDGQLTVNGRLWEPSRQ